MTDDGFQLNDRASDNWSLMFRIAELAGGEWPHRARSAAIATLPGAAENESDGVRLLRDIRYIFDSVGEPSMPASALWRHLVSVEDSRWVDYKGGRKISPRGVAFLLAPFGIESKKQANANHYLRKDFEDAWKRYL